MTIPRVGLLPNPVQPATSRPLFRQLAISSSGLSAQRQRMETIANNIANAETTRGADGAPYRRRVARLEAVTGDDQAFANSLSPAVNSALGTAQARLGGSAFEIPADPDSSNRFIVPLSGAEGGENGVRVASITEDTTEGPLVYDPGHPDANEQGYVRMPNVRVTDELVDLMDAKRIYEANATVFQSAKQMLKRALDI